MISAPDGAVFVGSGNEGQIPRMDATGKSTLFFDAEELEVHAHRRGAGRGHLCRDVAGRQDLQGRRVRHRYGVLRSV